LTGTKQEQEEKEKKEKKIVRKSLTKIKKKILNI